MAYTTIDNPTDYFNTITWSGVDGSDRALTGVGFQPDLVWSKARTDAYSNVLFDAVRGAGSNKELYSDLTQSEGGTGSTASNGFISSFDSDGFSTDNGSANTNLYFNASGKTYVAWNWLAGGSASSNSDGSITSSVSANTTAGFSIVSYTGSGTASNTVGHGLGVTPNAVIIKSRSLGARWVGWQTGLTSQSYNINLNYNNAEGTVSANSDGIVTNIGASTFSFSAGTGGLSNVNNSGATYIAYCFAEKKGYSKFGSYTGNGNADGTFVYTGFKPAWLLIKRSDGGTDNWNLYDNKRLGYNTNYSFLIPNESNAENTTTSTANLDILSNGFKIRGSTGHTNTSGGTYIYMAFAEAPFVTAGTKAAGTAR